MTKPNYFRVVPSGDTVIFVAARGCSFAEDEARDEVDALLSQLDQREAKHAVLDLGELDYFGSTALYLMVRLWKVLGERDGRLALCNLNEVGREIINTARFDTMLTVVTSRDQALECVRGEDSSS